jgi:hypothetical protein
MNQGTTLVVLIALFVCDRYAGCCADLCSEDMSRGAACLCREALRCDARGNCRPFCQNEFDRCMRTGEFRGRVCHKKKLIKQ